MGRSFRSPRATHITGCSFEKRARRGQSLVLFSLCVMLLALMVFLTVGIGVRIREKIELQTVADTAAYSNAVVTARTFNAIAVINRAEIAHAVAILGAQSLISWTTLFRSTLQVGADTFESERILYLPFLPDGCAVAGLRNLSKLASTLRKADKELEAQFDMLDKAAGREVFDMQAAQLVLYAGALDGYSNGLTGALDNQNLAREVVNKSLNGSHPEWQVPGSADTVSKREIAGGLFCSGSGAVCDMPLTVGHAVNAAMGSRGYTFVTSRLGSGLMMAPRLQAALLPATGIVALLEATDTIGRGSGLYGKSWNLHGEKIELFPAYASYAIGEDHGIALATYFHALSAGGGSGPCLPLSVSYDFTWSQVMSGLKPDHSWRGGKDAGGPLTHRLFPCTGGPSSCPGVFPPFVDYNALSVLNEGDNFGQPKNMALLVRDYGARTTREPWELAAPFTFNFTPGGAGVKFDNGGREIVGAGGGTALSKQVALSTGIAYYHRGESYGLLNHWAEPPNMLNPYWRATLVAPDVDDQGLDDVESELGASGNPAAPSAWRELRKSGFKGFQ